MKGDEERSRAAGCDGYIAKPLRYQEFLATIDARLAQGMTREPATISDHQPRVLIVDDERHNRKLLEAMLQPGRLSHA